MKSSSGCSTLFPSLLRSEQFDFLRFRVALLVDKVLHKFEGCPLCRNLSLLVDRKLKTLDGRRNHDFRCQHLAQLVFLLLNHLIELLLCMALARLFLAGM